MVYERKKDILMCFKKAEMGYEWNERLHLEMLSHILEQHTQKNVIKSVKLPKVTDNLIG